MRILWYIFLPSVYLLIAALVQIFAARARKDAVMTSEQLEQEDVQ